MTNSLRSTPSHMSDKEFVIKVDANDRDRLPTMASECQRCRSTPPNPMKMYLADPGPMGLFAFATICALSGTVHSKMFGNVDTGIFAPALTYAGFTQIVAGFFDFLRGNQVGGSTFIAFGIYWFTNGLWSIPFWNMTQIYENAGSDITEFRQFKGVFALCFGLIAFTTTLCDMKGCIFQIVLMSLVVFDFLILAFMYFSYNRGLEIFIGYLFIFTGVLAYYEASALFLQANSNIHLPLGRFKPADKSRKRHSVDAQFTEMDLENKEDKYDIATRHESRLRNF